MKKLITLLALAFCLNGEAQYTKLLDFSGSANGEYPYGTLVSDGTYFYGMTYSGGIYGSIFKIKPDGSGFTNLYDFAGNPFDGSYPFGSLFYDGTYLYGMTNQGGLNNDGMIFKLKPDGTSYDTLLSFNSINGGYPHGSIISDGTYLYGMTFSSNTTDHGGLIFKIKPDGTGYDTLLNFIGINGLWPDGSLFYDGTFLYGTTSGGGVNNDGTIFKIAPNGTGYTKLLDFNGTNGSTPYGNLISDGTYLYGMTEYGGTGSCTGGSTAPNACGSIFKIKPDGTNFDTLLNFNTTNGANPTGSLVYDGTFLYGMTRNGGANNIGTTFKIKPDGTGYTKLFDLNGTINGSSPWGSFILNGVCLYGMTNMGGANNYGTIFKYCLAPAGIEQYASNNEQVTIYPNPTKGIVNIELGIVNENTSLQITDMLGNTVKQIKVQSSQFTVDATDLAEGVYIISLQSTEGVVNKRVVIVR